MLLLSCGETTEPDPCDPESGIYIRGKHYVNSEFIDKEKNWDYKAYAKYLTRELSYFPHHACIPIEDTKTLREKLRETEEISDMEK